MDKNIQAWIRNILLIFVFVSIGFSLGKETMRRSLAEKSPAQAAVSPRPGQGDEKTVVYYMHGSFRCATCNEIERLTRQLVETQFPEELKGGTVEFKEINFQKDEELAQRYKVGAGCVIVANIADGKDKEYKTLNDVWTLYSDPPKFDEYLGDAIRKSLTKRNSGERK